MSHDHFERTLARGPESGLTPNDLVEIALGNLAREGRFDLIPYALNRLGDVGYIEAVSCWVDTVRNEPDSGDHYMPHKDRYLPSYLHFPEGRRSCSDEALKAMREEVYERLCAFCSEVENQLNRSAPDTPSSGDC